VLRDANAMLSLELNDAGLILARGGGDAAPEVLAEEPGFALAEETQLLTGSAAVARARLRPLFAHNRYWRELAVEPLPRELAGARTAADLAFAQLDRLLAPVREASDGILLAVPAGYTREQLGLLLGVTSETGVVVRGLVDAALAACSLEPAPPRILHLDLELHRATLTVLEREDTGGQGATLRRGRFEIHPRHGWLGLTQTWIELIAETFVRRTRFDPLHHAATEQHLADALPGWIERIGTEDTLPIELEFAGNLYRVEIPAAQLVSAVEPHYDALIRLVQAVRPAGYAIELRLGERVARLPGLLDRFAILKECEISVLPRGAAALGSLHHAAAITRSPDAVTLVYRLPVAGAVREQPAATVETTAPTPAHRRPTHVLHGARAWRIDGAPLTLGWAVPADRRRLDLPPGTPGLSRAHCTLSARNGSVILEDHSTFGSWVNDERVTGPVVLEVGDRLRLGAPGITVQLIQLVGDDGATQD
jgi:FHA domain